MSPGSSPSSASSSSSPFSSSWIISELFQNHSKGVVFKNSQSPRVVFDPSSHLTLPGPEEVLDVDVRVQSRQVGVSVPDDKKISIMIFQIRLTLYVWQQVCPFTNFTCNCFYWEWAELFLAPHIFTFSHPGTCSVTTCPGLGLGVPVNLVLRS